MATTDSHGYPEPTDDTDEPRGRVLAPRLRELTLTIVDALTTATNMRPGPDFTPDGDWVCKDDRAMRKTWEQTGDGISERVQVSSSDPAATWEVTHQRPDGTTETIGTDLEREAAFQIAERLMADMSRVPIGVRTGRAAD